jgi:replicative DNA helicase
MKKKVLYQTEFNYGNQIEIERIVLGSLILNSESIYEIVSEFDVKYFVNNENILVAESIIKLHLNNKPIDLITVVQQLTKDQNLSKIGGSLFVSNLTNSIGSTLHIQYHFRLLQQYWLARYISQTCSEAQLDILEYKKDIFEVKDQLIQKLEKTTDDIIKKEIAILNEIHKQSIQDAIKLLDGNKKSGVPTGLNRLDLLTNGFQNSDLIVLAGRTSMGKTAFALSILLESVVYQKIPVAFFSLEMSKEQLVGRIQSMLSKVNVSQIIKKQLNIDEINLIFDKCKELESAPLFIDDTANLSLLELKTKARKLVRENEVKMIVVDYLQLMKSGMKTLSREQEVAEISKGLKALAKELQIPVIALSQLSRGVETRTGSKKPMLSDLRDSGQIEQDADMVLFCFRPEYYEIPEYDCFGKTLPSEKLFVLIIAKHRNGQLGEIPLTFIGENTLITNYYNENELYYNEKQVKNDKFVGNSEAVRNFQKNQSSNSTTNPANQNLHQKNNSMKNPNNDISFDSESGEYLPF